METHRVWIVEEVLVDGKIAQRQSLATYQEDEKNWQWICPDILNEKQKEEWHRIMDVLSNVNGEDLRHIICGVGLLDHCLSR